MAARTRTSDLDRLVAADALEALVLQDAQHLGLQGRRHVADLVEKERAAVALLELADAAAVGPGEGALLVAEQFALQQRLRDGGAVDGQERLVGPLAVVIEGAGHQFLARAAFAQDQHVDVLRRDPADGLAHLLHDRTAADDAVGAVLGRQHGRHAHQPGRLEGAVEDLAESLQIDRLDEVIEGAALHGLDGRLRGAVGRDEDDRPPRVAAVDLAEDVQAGAVGQLQVEHDHVGTCSAIRARPSAAVAAVKTSPPPPRRRGETSSGRSPRRQ